LSLEQWVQIISTLGFPICCCIALFLQNHKLNVLHRADVEKMLEAVNNNTLVIQHLTDTLILKEETEA